jgi:tetratricopeptide (TPR) repeat protein
VCAFAQQPTEEAIATHFQAGQQAIKSGQLELAVTEFKKVLALSPDLAEAQVNLGLAYHLLGQYADSTAVLAKVARRQPDLAPANLFLGIGYLKLGSPRKAVPPLEQVVRVDPGNREARRALAACRLAGDDYREAARQFQALFPLEPEKPEAWYRLGRDYTDAASRLVRRMSLEHRRTAWGHRLAGDLYYQTERWEMAAQEYLEALAVERAQAGLDAALGSAYLHQGKAPEARAEFSKELERDPQDEQARLGLAEVSLAAGEVDAAWEQIDHLWKNSPEFLAAQSDFPRIELGGDLAKRLIAGFHRSATDGPSHFLLAGLYRIAGDNQKAQEQQTELERLTKSNQQGRSRNPQETPERLCRARRYTACAQALESNAKLDAAGYLLLGKARLAMRQLAPASDAFAAALALAGDGPEILYHLARSYQVLADASFSRMEELAPNSWRTHQMRGEAYKLRYDDAKAIREYERAAELRPDTPELYEELGFLYQHNSLPDQARAALEKTLKLEPSRARALYLLGQLYVNGREQEKGIPYLQKALRYDANLLEARAFLGRAYLRAGKPQAAATEIEKALSLDFYGDLHYLLFRAYKALGKTELARAALKRSGEMRKNSLARDRDKLERWMKN